MIPLGPETTGTPPVCRVCDWLHKKAIFFYKIQKESTKRKKPFIYQQYDNEACWFLIVHWSEILAIDAVIAFSGISSFSPNMAGWDKGTGPVFTLIFVFSSFFVFFPIVCSSSLFFLFFFFSFFTSLVRLSGSSYQGRPNFLCGSARHNKEGLGSML